MPERRTQKSSVYTVLNPQNEPKGEPIITVETEGKEPRYYYEGDPYDGHGVEGLIEEGLLARTGGDPEQDDAPSIDGEETAEVPE